MEPERYSDVLLRQQKGSAVSEQQQIEQLRSQLWANSFRPVAVRLYGDNPFKAPQGTGWTGRARAC